MTVFENLYALDSISMYRSVLPPDYFMYGKPNKIYEAASEITHTNLMKTYYMLEGFQSENNAITKGREAIRKVLIRDFLKINKWDNLRVNYDILSIKVHYAPNGNRSYHSIIFSIKVPSEDNTSFVIISPQVQINANTKIQISTSVYGFHFKDPACLNKDINWPLALIELREYLDTFWNDFRKDCGADLKTLPDNQRWVVSRFDIEADAQTMNPSHSYYVLERLAESSLPGYDRGEYRSGKSLKYFPKGVLRKKRNSFGNKMYLAKLPAIMVYEKSLELQKEHQKQIPSTLRYEKEYDRISLKHKQTAKMKRRISDILNYRDDIDDDTILDNNGFLKLMAETFGYQDHLENLLKKHYQAAKIKLEKLPNSKLDDLRLLELINRNNGTGSLRTYAEIMDSTKYFVEKSLKRLARLGLVWKAHRKWCISDKAEKILRGDNYDEFVTL